MSSYVVGSLIGGGFVLVGAALAAVRDHFSRIAERNSARAGELRSALREYLAALDVLALEIDQQPSPPTFTGFDRLLLRLGAAMGLDFIGEVFARLLHRATYGRRAEELMDRLSLAATQLRLIAPDAILLVMTDVEEATRRAGPDAREFKREWDAIRDDVRGRMRRELAETTAGYPTPLRERRSHGEIAGPRAIRPHADLRTLGRKGPASLGEHALPDESVEV